MNWDFLIKDKHSLCVSTDTRHLPEGCVFVALKGEHFNGNHFALQALETGAAYAIVDEDIPQTCSMKQSYNDRLIRVENALIALQDLARQWREELGIKAIGITGTNGKTTTKELLAAVLKTKYNLLYTQGNLNNQIGVPLTVLSITRDHDLALIEMGASHPGDIKELVDICEPDCGLITNVGKAHLLGFGSFEGVMCTKRELYDYLVEHGGTIFRNADNAYLSEMQHQAEHAHKTQTILYNTGSMLHGTHLVGDYNSENVQAALCVGEYFGIERSVAEQAIRDYVPANNRSQLLKTKFNTVVIDAYNANVTSMTAALTAFSGDTVILGDMLELGEYSEAEHEAIVKLLRKRGFKEVLLVGSEFEKVAGDFASFADVEALKLYLTTHPLQGRHILLKGSHGIHLEKVIENI